MSAFGRTDLVGRFQFVLRFVLAIAIALLALPLFLNAPAFADGEEAPPPPAATEEPPPSDPEPEPQPEDPPPADPEPEPEPETEEPQAEEPEAEEPEAEEPANEAPAQSASNLKPTTQISAGKGLAAGADTLAALLVTDPIDCQAQSGTNLGTGKVDGFNQNTQEDAGGSWINGNLNANNSDYTEGDFVPQRVLLSEIQPGLNQLVFTFDITKSSTWAYDFVDHLAILDEPGASISWDAAAPVPPPGAPAGTITVTVTITFDVPDGTDGEMIIRWDGHIASELDHGPGTGAGSISGSPYHFSLGTLNCDSAGSMDNQLQASALDAGTLTIIKDAVPNAPDNFPFTISGNNNSLDFWLDDDGVAAGQLDSLTQADPNPNSVTFFIGAATYDITEMLPGGSVYQLTNLVCVEGPNSASSSDPSFSVSIPNRNAHVTLTDDSQVICTFTNTPIAPKLTLVKNVVNGNTGANADSGDWTLTANGPTNVSGAGDSAAIVNQTVQPGTYNLSESGGPAGYTASAWNCVGGNQTDGDTVDLAFGDTVTCTITNTAQQPELTLVKVVDNGNTGANADSGDWTLNASGPTPFSGAGDSGTIVNVPVAIGNYDLSESGGPAGYDASAWNCVGETAQPDGDTVTIGLGDDVTCTITNTAQQPELTLVKIVDNGNTGANADSGDWTLNASGPTPFSGAGDSGTIVNVPVQVGNYNLSESGGPAGYDASDWVCVGETAQPDGDTVTIGLGDDVTCTITNTAQESELTLVKIVQNGNTGADNDAADWTLTAAGPTPVTGPGGSAQVIDEPVAIGTYNLSENGPAGYDPSAWVCTGGNQTDADSVEIGLGDDVTCTITNTAQQPELTLIKIVDNGDTGADNDAADWTLTAAGPTPVTGPGGSAQVIDEDVAIGTYNLSEAGPNGYQASSWDCTGGNQTDADTVEIGLGDDVTCTITNTALTPTLTLVKDVDHNNTGDDALDTDFTLTATGSDTISGEEGDPAITGAEVAIGTYELTEVANVAGYELVKWECTGDAAVDHDDNGTPNNPADDTWSVTVGLDDDVVCEAFNIAIPSDWIVEKSSDPISGSTVEPGDQINYTITVTRVGDGVNVFNVDVVDTLTGIDMGWVSDLQVSGDAFATPGAGIITLHINELSDTVTMTYTVTVGEVFGATLKNVVTPGTQPCVDPDPDPLIECDETTHFTPHWTLDKSVELLASPGDDDGLAEPGERLTFTLELTNDSDAVVEDVQVTDDLSDVLDNATLVDTPAQLAAKGLVLNGSTLTWTVDGPIPATNPDTSVTVSYTVEINAHQFDVTLRNIATPVPGDGGECIPAGDLGPNDNTEECETETTTPPVTTLVIEKQDFETGEPLAGATFVLYIDNAPFADPANPVIGDEDKPAIGSDVSGDCPGVECGLAKFDELQMGHYLVEETVPPAGYTLPAQPVMAIEINADNFVRGGEMTPIVFRDPTTGQITILSKQQYEFIDGEWEQSDGLVDFGDFVKYVVPWEATGPKNFYNVEMTDYVPGFNPVDDTSTQQATLVDNTAVCTGAVLCEGTLGPDGKITFTLGDVFPGNGESVGGAIEFVIEFPQAPDDPVFVDDLYTDTLWNQAYLDYDFVVGGTLPVEVDVKAKASKELVLDHDTLSSNEVVVRAELEAEPIVPPPPPDLPDTGAQAYLGQLALLGGLLLALGVALAARGRRKEGGQHAA